MTTQAAGAELIKRLNTNSDDELPFAVKLAKESNERAIEAAKRRAERDNNDPAESVLKAYNSLDKAVMEVVDEHIERVRKSNERNEKLFLKRKLELEIQNRHEKREFEFEEAAQNAELQRDILRMRSDDI